MIKVSVLYPNSDGVRFDMQYYLERHLPMCREMLGAACRSIAVDHGVGGAMPGSPATYVVMAHMLFDSVAAYQAAFAPHVKAIIADLPNYTDVKPVVQVSEVKQ